MPTDAESQPSRHGSPTVIHLWFPGLASTGGIQVYSRFFLKTLIKLYPQHQYVVFIKNDLPSEQIGQWPNNVRFHRLGGWNKWLGSVLFTLRIVAAMLNQRPALIICGHLNFSPVADWLKRLTGVPYWAIAHGVDAWNISKPNIRSGVRHADRIVSASRFTAQRLINEQSLDPARVSVVSNTFDPKNFAPGPKPAYLLERYGISPQAKVILTVARLSFQDRYKGYDRLIQCMTRIRQHVPEAHYVLAGSGADSERIRRLIVEQGVNDCVTLTGYVPADELADHYNLCDAYAMPSDKEGFGIVFLEALACGKPVLAGNRDGSSDALCGGELGVLVSPDDNVAIADALIAMLQKTHPLAILQQPELLRSRAIEEHSLARFVESLRTLWETHGPDQATHRHGATAAPELANLQRVAVLMNDDAAEMICAIPAFRLLRERYRRAHLTLLCNRPPRRDVGARELIEQLGIFDEIATYERPQGFVALREFRLNVRHINPQLVVRVSQHERTRDEYAWQRRFFRLAGVKHLVGFSGGAACELRSTEATRLVEMLNDAGIAGDKPAYDLPVDAEAKKSMRAKVATAGLDLAQPYIVFGGGGRMTSQHWPLDFYSEALSRLHGELGVQVIGIGTSAELAAFRNQVLPDCPSLILPERTLTLQETCELTRNALAYFGNETAQMHLAAAVHCPTVVVMSSRDDPGQFDPDVEPRLLFRHPTPCAGCRLSDCNVEGHPCLRNISPQMVVEQSLPFLRQLLKESPLAIV